MGAKYHIYVFQPTCLNLKRTSSLSICTCFQFKLVHVYTDSSDWWHSTWTKHIHILSIWNWYIRTALIGDTVIDSLCSPHCISICWNWDHSISVAANKISIVDRLTGQFYTLGQLWYRYFKKNNYVLWCFSLTLVCHIQPCISCTYINCSQIILPL